MHAIKTESQTVAPAALGYMDREGRRWTLRDFKRFFVANFYQGIRIEDGTEVVVHRSDFLRTEKG